MAIPFLSQASHVPHCTPDQLARIYTQDKAMVPRHRLAG
jgi:hypothetical protein